VILRYFNQHSPTFTTTPMCDGQKKTIHVQAPEAEAELPAELQRTLARLADERPG